MNQQTEVVEEFKKLYQSDPEVVASAPGRVNIIGEHIDYSDGWVLPFAISFRTFVAIRRRTDDVIQLASGQRNAEIVRVSAAELSPTNSWVDYVLGVVKEFGIESGLDIYVRGEVPNGAGLSSSAALECAVAIGLNELFQIGKTKTELALMAQKAENDFVGMPCGIMDQAVSMLAEADHALLLDCRTLETNQVPLELSKANLQLLVIDTRAHHALVDGGYAARRASCEAVVAELGIPSLREATLELLAQNIASIGDENFKRARHAVTEMQRVHAAVAALKANDFETLGELLNQSHASLRDDYTVSCPELDVAVEAANQAGALGARLVGGGFGGSAIALVHSHEVSLVQQAVSEAYSASGFAAPRFIVANAAVGANVSSLPLD